MATSTSQTLEEYAPAKAEKRNITLSLSVETLLKAKVLAAQKGTSISGLLAQQIEEMAKKNDSYEQAKTRALALLRSRFGFDGIEHLSKEEIHDRRNFR